eukprot:192264-Alexandrium_andersonii.AAC.1
MLNVWLIAPEQTFFREIARLFGNCGEPRAWRRGFIAVDRVAFRDGPPILDFGIRHAPRDEENEPGRLP